MPVRAPEAAPSDAAIVARAAAGDERALAALYDRHAGLAYRLALAIVGDSSDAEEVVADAFAQVWRSAGTFDATRGSTAAWISTITRTRALDLLRARKRRAQALDRVALLGDAAVDEGLAPAADAADHGAEADEARVLVARSLAELPTPQRRVIELAYFGGLSQSEIAAHLSEPLGTVKTRTRAAMEKLRHSLSPLMREAT